MTKSLFNPNVICMQRRECIIGGVGADSEISFNISLQPIELMFNMARRSKRVWLFKVVNSNSQGLICFPLAMYARFLAYFPRWRSCHGRRTTSSTLRSCCFLLLN